MDRTDKYLKMEKVTDNPFLNMYDVTSRNRDGEIFHYYFASRRKEENLKCHTHKDDPDGIMIYAVCRQDPSKIVLVRQYRYPLNDFVYEMPAGLMDSGENEKETAVREFFEETGMEFTVYEGGEKALRRGFYTSVGLTDESVGICYGYASGEPDVSHREATEELEIVIADRREALRILREEKVAMKCAQCLIHFIQSSPEKPFAFLELL